jgi:hypothetical protein
MSRRMATCRLRPRITTEESVRQEKPQPEAGAFVCQRTSSRAWDDRYGRACHIASRNSNHWRRSCRPWRSRPLPRPRRLCSGRSKTRRPCHPWNKTCHLCHCSRRRRPSLLCLSSTTYLFHVCRRDACSPCLCGRRRPFFRNKNRLSWPSREWSSAPGRVRELWIEPRTSWPGPGLRR